MGAIYLQKEKVTVSEPAQKAIILHNGHEQVLILETDLKATAKTDILRFIPFPTEPKVSLAPESAIANAGKLVQKKGLSYVRVHQTKGGSSADRQPVAEVLSRQKLGAHDITVVKVNDAAHFSQWVQKRFKDKRQLRIDRELLQVARIAADYVKDGIPYFAFDFVSVDASDKSVAPVAYRFKSNKVYYPLRTSNTIGGEGKVQLFLLAIDQVWSSYNYDLSHLLSNSGKGLEQFFSSTAATVEPAEAESVYPGAAAFFEEKEIVLQTASYTGRLHFDRDIFAFMLTHYDPDLYKTEADTGGGPAAPGGASRPLGAFGRPAPHDPIYRADSIASERRNEVMSLANRPHYFLSAGKSVPLRDGAYSDGSIRIDMDRVAFGNLNEDAFQEAAVITEAVQKGKKVCELTVFAGLHDKRSDSRKLERTGSVLIPCGDIQGFSIKDRMIQVRARGGAIHTYHLLEDGRVTPSTK